MDALVLLLGELLAVTVVVGFVLFGDVLALALELLWQFVSWGRRRRRAAVASPAMIRASEEPDADRADAPPRTERRWARRAHAAIVVLLAVTIAAGLAANELFFEPLLRLAMGRVREKTGIEVTFDSATGSVFSFRADMRGVRLRCPQSDTSRFDLTADAFIVNVDGLPLGGGFVTLDEVRLSGLRGTFDRLAPADRTVARRAFEITALSVDNAELSVTDQTRTDTPIAVDLAVTHLESRPLRSRWALFDVLFRTNATGTMDGRSFTLETSVADDGRLTRWRTADLETRKVAAFIGGPLAWIQDGTVNIDVNNRWRFDETFEIDMEWRFVFENVRAEVPADLGPIKRRLAQPVAAFVNRHSEHLPVDFTFTVDGEGFDGVASLETAGLWNVFIDALTREVARLSGAKVGEIKAQGKKGVERFKVFFDRRRKPEEISEIEAEPQ